MTDSPASTTHLEITFADPDDDKKLKKFDCGQVGYSFSFSGGPPRGGVETPLAMHCSLGSTHNLPQLLRLLQEKIAFTFILGNPTLGGTVERTGFRCDGFNGVIKNLHLTGEPGHETVGLDIEITENPEFHFIGQTINTDGSKNKIDDKYSWKTR